MENNVICLSDASYDHLTKMAEFDMSWFEEASRHIHKEQIAA